MSMLEKRNRIEISKVERALRVCKASSYEVSLIMNGEEYTIDFEEVRK